MGTRINALLKHQLLDYKDSSSVLAKLASSTPAALAVRDYWLIADPEPPHDKSEEWSVRPAPPSSFSLNYISFEGPGSLFLNISAAAVKIRTGGRWRGFLSVDSLRWVHLAAFREIAHALGATQIIYFPDSDAVDELFRQGRTQNECISLLEQQWGSAQRCVDWIPPKIVNATEQGVPFVCCETIAR